MQRQYIFTKNGFYPENTGEETEDEESAEFLYDIGNIESPSKLTVSGYFLYLVSDAFFKELTRLPELEIARDKIKVAPTQECIERLLNAILMKSGYETDFQNWKQFFKVRSETIKVQWQCIWQRGIKAACTRAYFPSSCRK